MSNTIYDDLTNKELEAGYWYVTHRVLLRKILVSLLAIMSGGLFLYGSWGLIHYFIAEQPARQSLQAEIAKTKLNYDLLAEVNQPQALQIAETLIIKNSEADDFVTIVQNPNQQWFAESFDYYYRFGENQTNVKTEYVLPGQTKFVLYLNHQSDQAINSAQLVIENIQWKKVANYSAWQEKVWQFAFENKVLLSSKKSGLSEAEAVSLVQFDVLNKSPYNFRAPRFIILISRGGKIIGVLPVVVNNLLSGERRTETVYLFQSVAAGGAELEIIPDINILDPNIFQGYDGSGEIK